MFHIYITRTIFRQRQFVGPSVWLHDATSEQSLASAGQGLIISWIETHTIHNRNNNQLDKVNKIALIIRTSRSVGALRFIIDSFFVCCIMSRFQLHWSSVSVVTLWQHCRLSTCFFTWLYLTNTHNRNKNQKNSDCETCWLVWHCGLSENKRK